MIKINQLLASQNTVEDDKELSDKTEGLLNCTSSVKVSLSVPWKRILSSVATELKLQIPNQSPHIRLAELQQKFKSQPQMVSSE